MELTLSPRNDGAQYVNDRDNGRSLGIIKPDGIGFRAYAFELKVTTTTMFNEEVALTTEATTLAKAQRVIRQHYR